jgi:hypothetical protein
MIWWVSGRRGEGGGGFSRVMIVGWLWAELAVCDVAPSVACRWAVADSRACSSDDCVVRVCHRERIRVI